MNEIQKNITGVSIDIGRNALTDGQKNILEMMQKHLSEKRPITRDDILNCWIKTAAPLGFLREYDYKNIDGTYKYIPVDRPVRECYGINSKSLQWFKVNIGTCIVKGKILAIPIIEI